MSRSPVDAASLVVSKSDGTVLLGRRTSTIEFLGGYCAFPGGGLEPADYETAARLDIDPLLACGLREMMEETGLVVDGRTVRRGDTVTRPASAEEAMRWVTPDYSPIRFDTRFFLIEVDELETPQPNEEFEWARFERASDWLRRWERFELVLPPPPLLALQAIEHGTRGAAARMAAIDTESWIEFEPVSGIRQLPLRTPTLPPAEHTNAYVVGTERLLIVDPATYELGERELLLSLIEQLDRPVEGILLTHHHRDHVGAANWLRKKLGCPVMAHPLTKALIEPRIVVDQTLEEGDRIELGADRAGQAFVWEALFTPGHAPGHLVLDDMRPGARSMIVGDMVAAIGTIIVDPSEGDMGEYIRQLQRLRALPPRILFPAHGHPILDGHAMLDRYVTHRLGREAKIFAALEAETRGTAYDLLPRAYADTPEGLWPLAERSCLAHLHKLVHDGRVLQEGDIFRIAG